MRLSLITAAAAAAMALSGAAAPASAQVGFGVYVGPSDYDYEYGYRAYEPRQRGYGYGGIYEYRATPGVVARSPSPRNGCGEFFYWNGGRCVDARVTPPDIR